MRASTGEDGGSWHTMVFFSETTAYPLERRARSATRRFPELLASVGHLGVLALTRVLLLILVGALFPTRTVLLPLTAAPAAPQALPRFTEGIALPQRQTRKQEKHCPSQSEILGSKGLMFANAEQCS